MAFVLLFAAFISVVYYSSRPASFPQPHAVQVAPEMAQAEILQRDRVLDGLSSADLLRIRQTDGRVILPPTDNVKASAFLADCETLWNELQEFRDDPEFHQHRFSPGSRFARWRERAKHLHDNRPDKELVGSDIHCLTDRLLGVANDYAGIPDHPSSQEEWFLNYFLPVAKKAAGVSE